MKVIKYCVCSDHWLVNSEFDTEAEAIECAKGNLQDKPWVEKVECEIDDDGNCFKCGEPEIIWTADMAGDQSLDQDFPEAEVNEFETEFPESDIDELSIPDDPDFGDWEIPADWDDPNRFAKHEDLDIKEAVKNLEEHEDNVECKCCFDLFPKADCVKTDDGYVCKKCNQELHSHQGTNLDLIDSDPFDLDYDDPRDPEEEEEDEIKSEPVDANEVRKYEAGIDEKLEEANEELEEINYVEYKHSYCHILEPNLKKLNAIVHYYKEPLSTVKGFIFNLLKNPEVRWTNKEREFADNIRKMDNNEDIYNYVVNSIEKAKTIMVKVKPNGELASMQEGFEEAAPVEFSEEELALDEKLYSYLTDPSGFEGEVEADNEDEAFRKAETEVAQKGAYVADELIDIKKVEDENKDESLHENKLIDGLVKDGCEKVWNFFLNELTNEEKACCGIGGGSLTVFDYLDEKHPEEQGLWDILLAQYDKENPEVNALLDRITQYTEDHPEIFGESLEEHINDRPADIESDQELQGIDNAVVDCPVAKVIAHSEDEKPLDCKMEKPALEEPLAGEEVDVKVNEDLVEAKKDEDELPPDPEVVKLEVHQELNDLVADEIEAIDGYENVKADILDKPIEHKDEIIDTINHIESEEKEHIDELVDATQEIPFSGGDFDRGAEEEKEEEISLGNPVSEEPVVEESLNESTDNRKRLSVIEPGYQYQDEDGNTYTLYGDECEEDATGITYKWDYLDNNFPEEDIVIFEGLENKDPFDQEFPKSEGQALEEVAAELPFDSEAKVGDSILIINMEGEPDYCGRKGKIEHIDSLGQLHGTWGGCAVIPGVDKFDIITDESLNEDILDEKLDSQWLDGKYTSGYDVYITKADGKKFKKHFSKINIALKDAKTNSKKSDVKVVDVEIEGKIAVSIQNGKVVTNTLKTLVKDIKLSHKEKNGSDWEEQPEEEKPEEEAAPEEATAEEAPAEEPAEEPAAEEAAPAEEEAPKEEPKRKKIADLIDDEEEKPAEEPKEDDDAEVKAKQKAAVKAIAMDLVDIDSGDKEADFSSFSDVKLRNYLKVAKAKGFDEATNLIQAEISKRNPEAAEEPKAEEEPAAEPEKTDKMGAANRAKTNNKKIRKVLKDLGVTDPDKLSKDSINKVRKELFGEGFSSALVNEYLSEELTEDIENLEEASSAETRAYQNGGQDAKDLIQGRAIARIKDPEARDAAIAAIKAGRPEVAKQFYGDRKEDQAIAAFDNKMQTMANAGTCESLEEALPDWDSRVNEADRLLDELCGQISIGADDGDGYWYSEYDTWCNRNLYYVGAFEPEDKKLLDSLLPEYNTKLAGCEFYVEEDEDEEISEVGYWLDRHPAEEAEDDEDMVECSWCGEKFPKSECRYEKDFEWLCPQCEAALKSRGETLEFVEPAPQNESLKEDYIDTFLADLEKDTNTYVLDGEQYSAEDLWEAINDCIDSYRFDADSEEEEVDISQQEADEVAYDAFQELTDPNCKKPIYEVVAGLLGL